MHIFIFYNDNMNSQILSKEELLNCLQQVSKKYKEAIFSNAEFDYLKKTYVELRELKWKLLEFGYKDKLAEY